MNNISEKNISADFFDLFCCCFCFLFFCFLFVCLFVFLFLFFLQGTLDKSMTLERSVQMH